MSSFEDSVKPVAVAVAAAGKATEFHVPDFKLIAPDELQRRPDTRLLDNDFVAELANSIGDQGLIAPLLVRPSAGGYEIIAGSHRYAACKAAGMQQIPCLVVDVDDAHAALRMIDENLFRLGLSKIEEAEALRQRKTLYVELFPSAQRGIFHGNQHTVGPGQIVRDHRRFAQDTAEKLGVSERTIDRKILRAEKLLPQVKQTIRGTPLETGIYLDEMARVEPERQLAKVQADLNGEEEAQKNKQKRRRKTALPEATAQNRSENSQENSGEAEPYPSQSPIERMPEQSHDDLRTLLERIAGLDVDETIPTIAESDRAQIRSLLVGAYARLSHLRVRLDKVCRVDRETAAAAMAADQAVSPQLNLLTYIAEQSRIGHFDVPDSDDVQ